MSKCVLLSVRPQWCELIANGKKTIEVRKTRPKLETPFKCYIYQTKPKDRLITIMRDGDENYGEIYHGKPVFIKTYGEDYWTGRNQKVIGEFVCDHVKMESVGYIDHVAGYHGLESGTCLTAEQLMEYGKWAFLYGWHISALQIYDKPKELSEFRKPIMPMGLRYEDDAIKRATQSWCYVEEYDGKR